MPHVAFISLAGFRIHEQELLEYGMTLPGFHDRARALAELPALGLLTLAGMLPEHWTCSYRAPVSVDEKLIAQIEDERPDLVAISALTASIQEAYWLSDQLRIRQFQTVLGGLRVTACSQEATRHADAVVVGSGEPVWRKLLSDVETGSLNPLYRASRALPETEWALPRLDLLENVARFTLQTQRGCPFACDFCAASRLLERFREKPVQQIREELRAICQLCESPLIELADDNTFAGCRPADELLDAFRISGARWFTESDWRIGERPDVLQGLATSGCVQVLIGMESMVFRYPGMGTKQAELQRLLDSVEAIQESGVAVNACFILGAEGETLASIDRLTDFLLEAPFAEVQLTLQTPFPGTALRERLRQSGRLLSHRGWSYYSLFELTYQPDQLTVEELEQAFKESITHVYGPAASRRRKRIRNDIWKRHPRFRRDSTS
ncbi:B12-binding domain-containing radical SAM protein [Planctomicrobium sp. SH661]|uniref:B12-binding domain-containing radical SAM protein n=1 Tax=Planctomicrobium sp. SH661 TaxID=3448124 RepID=UPI003F5C2035